MQKCCQLECYKVKGCLKMKYNYVVHKCSLIVIALQRIVIPDERALSHLNVGSELKNYHKMEP